MMNVFPTVSDEGIIGLLSHGKGINTSSVEANDA